MADSIVLTRPTNGVSYGHKHEITADDVANGGIVFDFQNEKDLVANLTWLSSTGVIKAPAGMIIEYPAVGQVRIEDGTTTWVAGDYLCIVANWARPLS